MPRAAMPVRVTLLVAMILLGWQAAATAAPPTSATPTESAAVPAATAPATTHPTTTPARTTTDAASTTPPEKITPAQAAILGVVEGLTEYLPVSSTGHLILVGRLMGHAQVDTSAPPGPFGPPIAESDTAGAFEIVIQLGAILAVLGLYRRRVGQMAAGLVGRSRSGRRLLGLLLVAFLPAAVIGLATHKYIKAYLFSPVPVAIALAVGGVAMILAEMWYRRSRRPHATQIDLMTYRQALIIGFAQCLAMWPGTSRSMVTIVAALLVGLDMVAAAEFSFLLALPTLGAATLYEGYKSWDALQTSAGVAGLLIGLVVSGVVAAFAVVAFVRWLTRHGLTPFGVYRILLAAGVCWYLMR